MMVKFIQKNTRERNKLLPYRAITSGPLVFSAAQKSFVSLQGKINLSCNQTKIAYLFIISPLPQVNIFLYRM